MMRLLNTTTVRLESFSDAATTPSGAVLSHIRGTGEVGFQDLESIGMHSESTLFLRGFTRFGIVASAYWLLAW
jgi:hypothetical protein